MMYLWGFILLSAFKLKNLRQGPYRGAGSYNVIRWSPSEVPRKGGEGVEKGAGEGREGTGAGGAGSDDDVIPQGVAFFSRTCIWLDTSPPPQRPCF